MKLIDRAGVVAWVAMAVCGLVARAGENTYTGAASGDWDTASNWSLERVPTAEDDAVVAKAVKKQGTNALVAASLTLNQGAALMVGVANSSDRWPSLDIAGDLTLNGNATLTIYPGPTNGTYTLKTGGARVTVGGTTTLNGTSKIVPWTHVTDSGTLGQGGTGAPVVFDLQAFVLNDGTTISSTGCGFTEYSITPVPFNAYGFSYGNYFGGSHGGRGGSINSQHLPAYDSLLAPLLPGAGGGNGTGYKGGGTIRISATSAQVNGTMDASGTSASWSGAGAGGSIWLTAGTLSVGAKALFKVRGGNVGAQSYGMVSGAGAGGRIAVGVGLTAAQVDSLYATGAAANLATNDLFAVYPGQVNVDPGAIRAKGLWPNTWADAGTAVYMVNVGTEYGFAVENDADVSATLSPALGIATQAEGDTVSASAASPALMRGKTDVRRVCTGWEIRDAATGAVLASGPATSFDNYKMPAKNVKLVWLWATVENSLAVGTIGAGTVDVTSGWAQPDANFATVTATASSDDDEFQYWTGDVEPSMRTANPLTLPADRPRAVKAFFGKKTGATYTMAKSNNSSAFDWHDAATWTQGVVPGTNDTVSFVHASGTRRNLQVTDYACVKSMTVSGACSYLRVGCKCSNLNSAAALKDMASHPSLTATAYAGLEVLDDLTVGASGWLAVGGCDATYPVSLKVGGDLTVAGGLGVGAGSTNKVSSSLYDATGTVTVKGKMTVESTGVVYPCVHNPTGGSVVFRATSVDVAAGGAFNADALGYCQYTEDGMYVFPWPTHFDNRNNQFFGGSHGGMGGKKTYQAPTYGCTNMPVTAGMPGGNTDKRAAGVIRIEAGTVNLEGTLRAHGYNGGSDNYGSGAGGTVSVFVSETFTFSAETAVINVSGGNCGKDNMGAGGGGRAAVGIRLTEAQKAALLASDDVEDVSVSALGTVIGGFTAEGGSVGAYSGCTAGEAGTGVYLLNMAGDMALNVVGVPATFGDVTPAYGQTTHAFGKSVSVSAPASVYVSGTDECSRRFCCGYAVSNETSGVFASGSSNTGSFTMPKEEAWLYWYWTNLEHRLSVAVQGHGSVVLEDEPAAGTTWLKDGSTVRLAAVPDDGYVFVGWLGQAAGIDRTAANLAYKMESPASLTAVFASAAAGTKTWVGANGASWEDASSWSPEGMPGPNDAVVVEPHDNMLILVGAAFPVPARSLTTASTAWFAFGNGSETTNETIGLRISGDFLHRGRMQIGRQGYLATPVVEVGGNLTLRTDNSLMNFLSLMAAPRDNPESSEMYRLGGGRVTVGGTLRIMSGSRLRPVCEEFSGAPIVISAKELVVEQGGIVNASGDPYSNWELIDGKGTQFNAGYGYSRVGARRVGYAPGSPTTQLDYYHGASYGGLGCKDLAYTDTSILCTSTYGKDFAPYMPGSAGGNGAYYAGGAIRIDCRTATISGTLEANGLTGTANGGSSGGAIWLSCQKLNLAETAVFSAQGGAPCEWGASGSVARSGGGGGGRICITRRARPDEIVRLYGEPTLGRQFAKRDLTDASVRAAFRIAGTFNVNGGHKDAYPGNDGGKGTAVLVDAVHGLVIFFK